MKNWLLNKLLYVDVRKVKRCDSQKFNFTKVIKTYYIDFVFILICFLKEVIHFKRKNNC